MTLIHHWEKNMKMFFRITFKLDKQLRSREKVICWNIGDMVASNPILQNYLLFVLIWGGYDATPAMYVKYCLMERKFNIKDLQMTKLIKHVEIRFCYRNGTVSQLSFLD